MISTSLQWKNFPHSNLLISAQTVTGCTRCFQTHFSKTLQLATFFFPFLIFFTAICRGHKPIYSISRDRVFTHDWALPRSTYNQPNSHIHINLPSHLQWLSNPPSLFVRCVCVWFCAYVWCEKQQGLIFCLCLMRHKQKVASMWPVPALQQDGKHCVSTKGKTLTACRPPCLNPIAFTN